VSKHRAKQPPNIRLTFKLKLLNTHLEPQVHRIGRGVVCEGVASTFRLLFKKGHRIAVPEQVQMQAALMMQAFSPVSVSDK